MGIGSLVYRIVLVIHLLCAIGGFGSIFYDSIYLSQARKRGGREALGISEANHLVSSKVARKLVIATFITGIILVFLSKSHWQFSNVWVWTSIVLFAIYIAIDVIGIAPIEKVTRGMVAELALSTSGGCGTCPNNHASSTSPESSQASSTSTESSHASSTSPEPKTGAELQNLASSLDQASSQLAAMRGVSHLIILGFLYLMVFRP